MLGDGAIRGEDEKLRYIRYGVIYIKYYARHQTITIVGWDEIITREGRNRKLISTLWHWDKKT